MATTSVPKTPNSKGIASSIGTPIARTSGCLPQSSGTGQDALKHNMKLEYSQDVYTSQRLFDKIFRNPLSSVHLKTITEDCIKEFANCPPFPLTEASERAHYEPLAQRLNVIRESLEKRNLMANSIYGSKTEAVKFRVYDKPTRDGIGKDAPLRPDLVARRVSEEGETELEINGSDDRIWWKDVELCVEVKDTRGDMVSQGATYARSMSFTQRSRYFVLVLFYHFKNRQAFFGLFTPAWLCLSEPHELDKDAGQRGFIQEMARVWSCNDKRSAGFDTTCSNRICDLGRTYGVFYYRQSICYRVSLKGRRTRVDLIAVEPPGIPSFLSLMSSLTACGTEYLATSESQNEYVLRRIQGQHEFYIKEENVKGKSQSSLSVPRSEGTRSSSRLASQESNDQTSAELISEGRKPLTGNKKGKGKSTVSTPSSLPTRTSLRLLEKKAKIAASATKTPEEPKPSAQPQFTRLILKDSWPLFSRKDLEAKVFHNGNRFGVPRILRHYLVGLNDDHLTDTSAMLPDDAKFSKELWRELNSVSRPVEKSGQKGSLQSDPVTPADTDENEVHEPERRAHVRLLISTEGGPLEHSQSPKELLQAVMHAMIGYWELFKDGWLHRDVSIGNVLLMKTPEERDEIEGLDGTLTEDIRVKYFDKCVGFISDADLAVEWNDRSREVARQRSGTPPFMSCKLLMSMISNSETYHTAIDDLESFIWVTFWAILSFMDIHELSFTSYEQNYWNSLQSRDLDRLYKKRGFIDTLDLQLRAYKKQKKGNQPIVNAPSLAFAPFVELLADWLELALSRKTSRLIDLSEPPTSGEYEQIVETLLGQYLSIGLEHLEKMPNDWKYVSG